MEGIRRVYSNGSVSDVTLENMNAAMERKKLGFVLQKRPSIHQSPSALLMAIGVYIILCKVSTVCSEGEKIVVDHHYCGYDGYRKVLFYGGNYAYCVDKSDWENDDEAWKVFNDWGCIGIHQVREVMKLKNK